MKVWAQKSIYSKGFTIVELLIVVVVIAILAAITIVAYNGIQNQASDSVVKSDISTLGKKMALDAVNDGMIFAPSGISQSQPNAEVQQELTKELPFSRDSYTRTGIAFLYSVGRNSYSEPETPLFIAVSKSGQTYIYNGSTIYEYDGTWDEDEIVSELFELKSIIGWSCMVNYYTWSYSNGWRSNMQPC